MPNPELVRTADAALGIADPAAAVAALNAQTNAVTVDVATADIRAVLWPRLEYARIAVIGRRPEPYADANAEALVLTAITAVSLLDSGRTIFAADEPAWAATVGGLLMFTGLQPPVVSNESYLAVSAMRTVQVPKWRGEWDYNLPLSAEDLASIRSVTA